MLAGVPLIPKFASGVIARVCGLRDWDTRPQNTACSGDGAPYPAATTNSAPISEMVRHLTRQRRPGAASRDSSRLKLSVTSRGASTTIRKPVRDRSTSRHARTENPSSNRIHALLPTGARGLCLKSLRITTPPEPGFAVVLPPSRQAEQIRRWALRYCLKLEGNCLRSLDSRNSHYDLGNAELTGPTRTAWRGSQPNRACYAAAMSSIFAF